MLLSVNFSSFHLPKDNKNLKIKLLEIRKYLEKQKIKSIEISYPRIKDIHPFVLDKFKHYHIILNFNSFTSTNELYQYLELSKKFKSNLIRIKFSNKLEFKRGSEVLFKKKLKKFIDTLIEVKNFIKNNNYYIAIENHQDLDSNDFDRIFKSVNSNNIGICFDISNSIATCEEPINFINKFHKKILLVHVKNYFIYYCPNKIIELNSTSIDLGSLNIISLVNLIKNKSYCKFFSIEIGNKEKRVIDLKNTNIIKTIKNRDKRYIQSFEKFINKFNIPYNNIDIDIYKTITSSLKTIKKKFKI